MKLKIFTDGGARGNPGPAGAGVIILDELGKVVRKLKKYLGKQTNNFAEYSAVILALQEAKKMGAEELEFFMDSELAVKQLNGEYKIKNIELGKLFIQIYNLSHNFKKITYKHISRQMNKLADSLANQAMDENTSSK